MPPPKPMKIGGEYIFYFNVYIKHEESYEIIFSFFNEKESYIPIARDKIILKG